MPGACEQEEKINRWEGFPKVSGRKYWNSFYGFWSVYQCFVHVVGFGCCFVWVFFCLFIFKISINLLLIVIDIYITVILTSRQMQTCRWVGETPNTILWEVFRITSDNWLLLVTTIGLFRFWSLVPRARFILTVLLLLPRGVTDVDLQGQAILVAGVTLNESPSAFDNQQAAYRIREQEIVQP